MKVRYKQTVLGAAWAVLQPLMMMVVFAVFSTLYLKEALRWNHFVAFALLVGAAFFVFKKW